MFGSARIATNHMGGGGAGVSAPAEGSWNIDTVAYNSKSFSITGQETTPNSLFFKPDGTKLYIAGTTQDRVFQYSLSTAWDISTASYDVTSLGFTSQEGNVYDIFFKPDGTRLFVLGLNNTVYHFSLGTAWDIGSATYTGTTYSVSGQSSSLSNGLFMKPDGLKFYVLSASNDAVYQYSISSAWAGTSSYDSKSVSIASQTGNGHGLWFKPDGTRMYVTGKDTNSIYQYSLSTAWDVSTATYASKSYDATSQDGNPSQIYMRSDGLALYLLGNSTDTIYQYSMT